MHLKYADLMKKLHQITQNWEKYEPEQIFRTRYSGLGLDTIAPPR